MAALSSDDEIPWEEIMTLAKLIPCVCHNINRYTIYIPYMGNIYGTVYHIWVIRMVQYTIYGQYIIVYHIIRVICMVQYTIYG